MLMFCSVNVNHRQKERKTNYFEVFARPTTGERTWVSDILLFIILFDFSLPKLISAA